MRAIHTGLCALGLLAATACSEPPAPVVVTAPMAAAPAPEQIDAANADAAADALEKEIAADIE